MNYVISPPPTMWTLIIAREPQLAFVLLKMVRFVLYFIDDDGMHWADVGREDITWAHMRDYLREQREEHPSWKMWLCVLCI